MTRSKNVIKNHCNKVLHLVLSIVETKSKTNIAAGVIIYDQMSYDLGLSTKEGLRTPLAKLLARAARSAPAGVVPSSREEKDMMLNLREKGLVNYGLDLRGDYRGHINGLGLNALQRI